MTTTLVAANGPPLLITSEYSKIVPTATGSDSAMTLQAQIRRRRRAYRHEHEAVFLAVGHADAYDFAKIIYRQYGFQQGSSRKWRR